MTSHKTIFGRFFPRFLQHLFVLNPAGRWVTAAVNSVVMCLRFVVRASSKFSQSSASRHLSISRFTQLKVLQADLELFFVPWLLQRCFRDSERFALICIFCLEVWMTFQGVGEGICRKKRSRTCMRGSSSVARCFLSFLFIRLSLQWLYFVWKHEHLNSILNTPVF